MKVNDFVVDRGKFQFDIEEEIEYLLVVGEWSVGCFLKTFRRRDEMKVVNIFMTHKTNLEDLDGLNFYDLNSFDVEKDLWKEYLARIFCKNPEAISDRIGEIQNLIIDPKHTKKFFELNDVYVWIEVSHVF